MYPKKPSGKKNRHIMGLSQNAEKGTIPNFRWLTIIIFPLMSHDTISVVGFHDIIHWYLIHEPQNMAGIPPSLPVVANGDYDDQPKWFNPPFNPPPYSGTVCWTESNTRC
jgi:hypothetical protein